METTRDELASRDLTILDFEEGWWRIAEGRTKRQAIRDDLGISSATYYASLEPLLDAPAARTSHPLLIARLKRRRTERRRALLAGNEPIRRSP